jgi:hypothetical protein
LKISNTVAAAISLAIIGAAILYRNLGLWPTLGVVALHSGLSWRWEAALQESIEDHEDEDP